MGRSSSIFHADTRVLIRGRKEVGEERIFAGFEDRMKGPRACRCPQSLQQDPALLTP